MVKYWVLLTSNFAMATSVCVSDCHKSEFYENNKMDRAGFDIEATLSTSHTVLKFAKYWTVGAGI